PREATDDEFFFLPDLHLPPRRRARVDVVARRRVLRDHALEPAALRFAERGEAVVGEALRQLQPVAFAHLTLEGLPALDERVASEVPAARVETVEHHEDR